MKALYLKMTKLELAIGLAAIGLIAAAGINLHRLYSQHERAQLHASESALALCDAAGLGRPVDKGLIAVFADQAKRKQRDTCLQLKDPSYPGSMMTLAREKCAAVEKESGPVDECVRIRGAAH